MAYAASHFARQVGTPWSYGLWFLAWLTGAAVLRNVNVAGRLSAIRAVA